MPVHTAGKAGGIVMLVAVALTVVLALQVRSLRRRYLDLRLSSNEPYAGYPVPRATGVTPSGDSVTIGDPSPAAHQLLFFFTTTCEYCRATVPAWNVLTSGITDDERWAVYGVQLDAGRSTALERQLRFPVVILTDRRLGVWYRIRAVPLTMIVSDSGVVVYAKIGEIVDSVVVDSILNVMSRVSAGSDAPNPAPHS
jgi:hypothetical protein